MNDLFDYYLEYLEETESPRLFHRWSLISAIGAMLNRQVYIEMGHEKIYPNQYVCLLGNSGSRKSTAIKIARDTIKHAGFEEFDSDKSTTEKFMEDLAHQGVSEDLFNLHGCEQTVSNAWIVAPELEDFIGRRNNDLVARLTNLWDNLDTYRYRTRGQGSIIITQPTISMVGAATPVTFQTTFEESIIGSGMLSRMILVYGGGPRKSVPTVPPFSPAMHSQIVHRLEEIKKLKGEMIFTSEALAMFSDIYNHWKALEDSRLDSYCGRRHTHLMKLCMIYAASRLSLHITEDDVIRANTVLVYTEAYMSKALGEFGGTKVSNGINSIMRVLSETDRPLEALEIFRRVSTEFKSIHDMLMVLQKLKMADKVDRIGKGYMSIVEPFQDSQPHVDFTLMKEYHDGNEEEIENAE